MTSVIEAGRAAYLNACRLDVAVRKPGNVSLVSPGHRMDAGMFMRSAEASAAALFVPGATVGARIEAAVAATWDAVGCNTNLGIVLLCAPVAVAIDGMTTLPDAAALQAATARVLDALDLDDARAAYRAIAMAQPAGLGRVEAQDVNEAPTLDLRSAMRLAAPRDLIAAQYDNGFAQVFGTGLGALPRGFDPRVDTEASAAAVQRLYIALLAAGPDSHIVRKHGMAVAQTVMHTAQHRTSAVGDEAGAALAAWDEALKSSGINPGTTADFTVATLFVASIVADASRQP